MAREGDEVYGAERGYWVNIYFPNKEGLWWAHNTSNKLAHEWEESYFKLEEAPEDLKNWILLGLMAFEGKQITCLPGFEKYVHGDPNPSRCFDQYEIKKTSDITGPKLYAYLPRSLMQKLPQQKENK